MKITAYILLCMLAFRVACAADASHQMRTFFLEGVRTGRLYGPFSFQTGTILQLDTGNFRLDVLSAAGSFILTEQRSGTVFGVYELIQGRMIDAGYQIFTITRVTSKPLPHRQSPDHLRSSRQHGPAYYAPYHQAPYRVGITIDLVNQIAYDWKLDKKDASSARYVERRGGTVSFSRGILTVHGGVLVDAKWQETVRDPGNAFEEGSLSNGTGWKAGLSLLIPVFSDGGWSASIGGSVDYQRETFDLEYGQWQTIHFNDISSTNDTSNGVTNGVPEDVAPTIPGERFIRQNRSATLSETIVNLTARLDYTAPGWFVFAGLKAVPWSDTDLQAIIDIDDQRIPLSFERRHPFSAYAGAGFTYQDVHSYLEFEAGGVNAIRLGVVLSF